MNWKFNYWTVLFAGAAISWLLITCSPAGYQQDGAADPALTELGELQKHKISKSDALARYRDFKKYSNNYLPAFVKANDGKNPPADSLIDNFEVINPNVRYFKLPKGELREMLNHHAAVDTVFALLTFEKQEGSLMGTNLIDLIFYVEHGKNNADPAPDGEDDGTYYDFTLPCPDSCEPPPPFDGEE